MIYDHVYAGRIFLDGEIRYGEIGVVDGKIAKIGKNLKGHERVDFGSKIIFPGAIDVHVHFRDPGYTEKEDFYTGTVSAAFGGVVCALDMPNTRPIVVSAEDINEKIKIAKQKAVIDFGLYAMPLPGHIDTVAKKCCGFKVNFEWRELLSAKDTNFWDENTFGRVVEDINALFANGVERRLSIHCEHPRAFLNGKNARNLEEYCALRAENYEAEAITHVLSILKKYAKSGKEGEVEGGRKGVDDMINRILHIVHVSSVEGVGILSNHNISMEVTPHHILLSTKRELGAYGKVNPPIRGERTREFLWRCYVNGTIPILASDHAPHLDEEKDQEFEDAPAGVPGVETMLPLMLYLAKKGYINVSRVFDSLSAQPAATFGIHSKGFLSVGKDADFVVVDFLKVTRVKGKNLHYKCEWTPFEGFDAIFPYATVVRGCVVVRDGWLEADAGYGNLIVPR